MVPQQPPQPSSWGVSRVGQQPYADAQGQPPQDDAMDCPECGAHLEDMAHRRKHAIMHYGSGNIPRYPNHDQAADRKGAILGVDPATLRG